MVKGETKRMADKDKDQDQEQTKALEAKSGSDIQDAFVKLLSAMQSSSHVPIPFTFVMERPSEAQKILLQKLNDRLTGRKPTPPTGFCLTPISVAFPHCSDVLLAHVKIYETRATGQGNSVPVLKREDDITRYFDDYFMFCDHRIIYRDERLRNILDPALVGKIEVTRGVEIKTPGCLDKWFPPDVTPCVTDDRPDIQQEPIIHSQTTSASSTERCTDLGYRYPLDKALWPPPHCLTPSCVTLSGKRHLYTIGRAPTGSIRRLFMGDLVWLFYFERMGVFKILGVILDDIATQGKMPLSNGTVFQDVMDDVLAIITESMIRETKTGLSSTLRDRDSSYRRCLGWTSDVGRKLGLETSVNNAFNTHFHRFIQQALEYYKDKRLASAIQGIITTGKPSVSTIITISDTLVLLKKAFDPFDYGRNYTNTLNGIVWVIAAMALIRELRTSLGIPEAYEQPYEYIPAAYDILVMKGPITSSQTNRYLVHRECANDARDILLDLEVINHTDTAQGGELELWLDTIEDKVEGYRTAYRSLTGIDLGIQQTSAAGAPLIEQQV